VLKVLLDRVLAPLRIATDLVGSLNDPGDGFRFSPAYWVIRRIEPGLPVIDQVGMIAPPAVESCGTFPKHRLYAQLEMGLVEAANRALSGELARGPVLVAPMSAETALNVLRLHRAAVVGQGNRSGWKAPSLPLSQVQDGIIRKIEAIRRGRVLDGVDGDGGEVP